MPRLIANIEQQACSLEECIAALNDQGFCPSEEESLQGGARWLARLGQNREFLGDLLIEELKQGASAAQQASSYGAQSVMLSPLGTDYFLRANFWPSADEHMFRASGGDTFAYQLPHDHNFDFLTLGYFGPGYVSDYYEYDYEKVAGVVGEQAGLHFVQRATLSPGTMLHYRAHRDVHAQLPPQSLSVSINIMHASGAQGWLDQYRFDVESDTIAAVISHGGAEIFLRMAVGLGGEEAMDLAECFAQCHVSDRMRLTALEAQAGVLDGADRDALWRRAEASQSILVRQEAARRRAQITAEMS